MNFLFVTSFIAFYWGVGISVFVLLYGQNKSTRITFGLIAESLTLWIYGDFFYFTNAINYFTPTIWLKIVHTGAVFIPPLFIHFIFSVIKKKISKRTLIILYGVSVILLLLLIFTHLFIQNVEYIQIENRINVKTNIFYDFFVYYLLASLIGCYIILFKEYKTARDYQKAQIEYLFSAIVVVIISSLFYFPMFFGIKIIRLDNLFLCIYSSIMTYAIVKYRLVDIVFVIKRSIVYLILVSIIVFLMSGTIMTFGRLIEQTWHLSQWVTTILVSFIIVLIFQPLKDFVAKTTDKIFFQDKYDYQLILRDLSQKIGTIVDFKILVNELTEKLMITIKARNATLVMYNKKYNKFVVEGYSGGEEPKATLRLNDDLIDNFKRDNNVLVYYELLVRLEKEESDKAEQIKKEKKEKKSIKGVERILFMEALKKAMELFKAAIAVPIYVKGDLVGVLFLGPKLSDDIYNDQDLNLLETVAGQAGVALENARLINDVLELKNYNESVLKNMGSGVLTIDNDGKIVSFNHRAEEITGFRTLNIIGQSIDVLYSLSDKFKIFKETLNVKKGVISIETGLNIKGKADKIPVVLNTAVIKGSVGDENIGIVGEIIDLTEMKKLQSQIERNDRLASLGTMAAGIAHEIKNPMVSLKTFTQMMPKMFDNEEFRQKYTEIVPSQVERINDLMTALLHIGKPQKVEPQKMDINDAIREVLLLCESDRKSYDAEIIREYNGEMHVFADRGQMVQVILNMARNALQAMPKGGKLTVGTKLYDDNFVEIKIKDTGIGIPKENLDHLFDPFFSTKEEGTGLGLSIVYKIIQEHNGRIEVDSRVGEGTAFLIYLPKG